MGVLLTRRQGFHSDIEYRDLDPAGGAQYNKKKRIRTLRIAPDEPLQLWNRLILF